MELPRLELLLILCLFLGHGAGEAAAADSSHKWWAEEYEHSFLEVTVTILLLVLALGFEAVWHHLRIHVEHSYQFGNMHHLASPKLASRDSLASRDFNHVQLAKELVNRAGSEFMTLGFLATCIFFCNNAGIFDWCVETFRSGKSLHMPLTAGDWLHLCEFVHFQLFFAMILYFFVMSRIVKGSQRQIRKWEERLHRVRHLSGKVLTNEELKALTPGLSVFLCWREYFITRVFRWYRLEPGLFREILTKLNINPDSPESNDQFEHSLQTEFDFSEYLALCVSQGVRDSIEVHPFTWFAVIVLFFAIGLVNWFVKVGFSVARFMPIFMGITVVLLGAMRIIVSRKRHHVESVLQARLRAVNSQAAADDAEVGTPHLAPASANTPAEETNEEGHSRTQQGRKRKFHENHQTEMYMLRCVQVIVFLIAYMFARTLIDFDDWRTHTWMSVLYIVCFLAIFCILSLAVPNNVPMFLGIMALPPYIDEQNFANFRMVITRNRADAEILMLRNRTKEFPERRVDIMDRVMVATSSNEEISSHGQGNDP